MVEAPAGWTVATFRHWLHRARFLLEIEALEGVARYAATRLDRERPYLLYLFCSSAEERRLLRSAERRTHGQIGRWRASGFPSDLERLAWGREAVYLGGPDVLLPRLAPRWFWKPSYCSMCGDGDCRRGSTQGIRCQVVSEEIGALDDVEIADIFHMYRRDSESLLSCYTRIAEKVGLADVVETARPRWPDAYHPDPRGQ